MRTSLALGVLDVARAQVAHGAGLQAPDAGVADAHATPVRQQRARLLAGHQQRRGPVGLDLLAAGQEADTAAAAAEVGRGENGPEALEVQLIGDAGALEALAQRVQQAGRAARPGLALTPVGHAPVELARRPTDRPDRRGARAACSGRAGARARGDHRRRSSSSDDGAMCTCATSGRPSGRWASARSIPMIGVTPLPAVTNSSACSDRFREHELPGRRREPDHHAPARMADEVVGHQPARDPLDGDRDTTVAPARHRRERVGAPVPHAVDVDARRARTGPAGVRATRGRAAATASRNRASRAPRLPHGHAARASTRAGSAARESHREEAVW